MAAAGAGGGVVVKSYPADWAVFEVNEDTVDDILTHGSYASPEEFIANLNNIILSEKDVFGKCGAFNNAIENMEALFPDEDYELLGVETITYLAISKSAGIIGYLSIEQKLGEDITIADHIFTHLGLAIEAFVNKISWTCSFTNSEVEFRGKPIRDHIPAEHTINMGKYITDQVCAKRLMKLHSNVSNTKNITTMILFSVGTKEARPKHRKNGKLSACRFLEEWINNDGDNIMEFYDHDEFSVGLMYYYYRAGEKFIGSDLYTEFMATGSDISQGQGFVDVNYTCPSGLVFDKMHQIVNPGQSYTFIDPSKSKKRTRIDGGGTKRTRGRRRAYGRSSRRRRRN